MDQERELETARADLLGAVRMLKQGDLPGAIDMTQWAHERLTRVWVASEASVVEQTG
jgi:hypothetical protein